jgi:hypothetical protein
MTRASSLDDVPDPPLLGARVMRARAAALHLQRVVGGQVVVVILSAPHDGDHNKRRQRAFKGMVVHCNARA